MRTLTDHLSQYAAYHRDRRNIATHFVGVPMIVLGVLTGLARIHLPVEGFTAAHLVALGGIVFYLSLDLRYGLTMALLVGTAAWIGVDLAAHSFGIWLASALGLFGIGWVIQFVGHRWEGRRPAFVDDLVGLLVGPLFVAAEAGFMIGLRTSVKDAIEARVGPTRSGPATQAALS